LDSVYLFTFTIICVSHVSHRVLTTEANYEEKLKKAQNFEGTVLGVTRHAKKRG